MPIQGSIAAAVLEIKIESARGAVVPNAFEI